MITYKLTLLALIALLAGACRKDAPELVNPNHRQLLNTPSQIFEAYWHGMNNSYAFWDIDPTDWDQIYDEYLPQFKALDNETTIETQRLIDLYTAITEKLIDHHYRLTMSNFNASQSDIQKFSIRPGTQEVHKRDYYHEPLTFESMLPIIHAFHEKGRIQNCKGGTNEGATVLYFTI